MTDNTTTGADDGRTDEVVTLAHGAGSGTMRSLIEELVVSRFDGDRDAVGPSFDDGSPTGADGTSTGADGSPPGAGDAVGLAALDDGAVHPLGEAGSLVVTTDSHVVTPPTFPGGDIGRLAVAGTVNDLAVMGATEPVALTCSLVVQEGYPVAELEGVLESMRDACERAGTRITTGDTKVMGAGEVDGPVINTAGVGVVAPGGAVTDAGLSPGDAILLSGTVGDHGIALLSEREGFGFGGELESDVAPVNGLVRAALSAGRVTAMKDPTRGGLATTLNEMARKGEVGIEVEEPAVPVDGTVASAGEVLGIDPLSVANEGKVVLAVDPDDAEGVLEAIREQPLGEEAAIVGRATADHVGRVVLDTGFGRRYLSEPEGETLPRIC